MPFDEALADRIRERISPRSGVSEKKLFGGLGFFLRGNMCVGVWKAFLIARVGRDVYQAALQETGASPFEITGRPMTGWVKIDGTVVSDDCELQDWIDLAMAFVATLPAK